jgi:MFS family permease
MRCDKTQDSYFLVVLGRRKLWGIYFGHFAWGTTSTFFLTWFPTYLVTYRHLDFIKAGFYASLPFVGAFAGVLCSGALSDWLYRRGFSLISRARHRSYAGWHADGRRAPVKLPRFGGHRTICVRGVHDGQDKRSLPA